MTDNEREFQESCDRMVGQHVHLCLSSLVHSLASSYGDGIRCDASIAELIEQAGELSFPVPDYESAAIEEGWSGPYTDDFGATFFRDEGDGATWAAAEWQSLCQDHDIEPHECEVFEHWAVSDWLGRELEERGEKVDFDFANLTVWARTTTGQSAAIDSVIQDIRRALDADIADGRKRSAILEATIADHS